MMSNPVILNTVKLAGRQVGGRRVQPLVVHQMGYRCVQFSASVISRA